MPEDARRFLFGRASPSFADETDAFDFFPGNDIPPEIRIYSPEELLRMDPPELASHIARLQQLYKQAQSGSRVIAREFRDFRDGFTYFSRAASLAHKLIAADVDTAALLAISEIPRYFHCRFAALFFFDENAGLLELNRCTTPSIFMDPLQVESNAGHPLVELFFRQLDPFIIENIDSDGLVAADAEREFRISPELSGVFHRKSMLLPLRARHVDRKEPLVLGGMVVSDSARELGGKDAEDAILLNDLLSSSLYNAMLVKKLNDLAIIDPLTNIFNRRHLIDQITINITQSRRHGHSLSIAMLDIDHFKRVNDSHGHVVGDKVLRELADLLKDAVRTHIDILARYGGEEFVVVMPFTDLDGAVLVAERLRDSVMRHPFVLEALRLDLTCSIGVAEYAADESIERFIDNADLALYRAKNDGRNRVAAAPPAARRT